MKIIDRYILLTLLQPLAYCLVTFSLLYLVFDLFENISYFLAGGTPALKVLQYYAYLLPTVMVFVAPVSLLLSVLYSLFQLTRNNELIAMQASGMSLYRLLLPIATIGLFFSLALTFVNEAVSPGASYWTSQFLLLQEKRGDMKIFLVDNIGYMNQRDRRVWQIGQFNTKTYAMTNVQIIQRRPSGTEAQIIHAAQGQWLDGRWWLTDLVVKTFDESGFPMGADRSESRRELSAFSETPLDFLDTIKDPLSFYGQDYFSARALRQYINKHQLSSKDKAKLRTNMHYRLAIPWACLISTLIGIPFGVKTGRRGVFLGVVLSVVMFFSYYVLINVFQWAGKAEVMAPWLAGWMPTALFLILAVVMIHRQRRNG